MRFSSALRALLRRLDRRRQGSPDRPEPIRESVTDAGYYEEISLRYASAQLVGIILLSVFLAVSLLTDSALLSADSVAFFAKDMTTSISMRENAARDTLVYSADEDNRYALFREGLSVLGGDKLTVFTATGREAYTEFLTYATPRLSPSGRYLIAYDLGGTAYSLYNSFACVESGQTDSPIRTVTAANDGSYAIVTDGEEYASLVTLYNEHFRAVNRYHLEEYTVCASLAENGEQLLLASVSSQDGRMTTHLMLATPGRAEANAEWTVSDAYPVAVQLTEKGEVILLSTDFIVWYDKTGEELERHNFVDEDVRSFRMSAYGCVLLCRANTYDVSTRARVFDKSGDEVYNVVVDTDVRDATLYDSALAVLTDRELLVYRDGVSEPDTRTALKGDYTAICATAEDEFIVCGDARAIVVRAISEKD